MSYIGNAGLHDQKIAQGEQKEGQANDLTLSTISNNRHIRNLLEERIDKWSNRRSLGQDNEAAQKHEHHDDRKEPKFLSLSHEIPEFHDKITHAHLLLTSLKLVLHVRMGPWGSDNSIGRTRLSKCLPHRVFAHEAAHKSNWSHQGIKDNAEQNPGVHPPQNMPNPHPPCMDRP